MCRGSCLPECGPFVIEGSTRSQSKVTGGRHQGANRVTCEWNRLNCKEDSYVFIFCLPVLQYINTKLDSFLWSTQSLAMGRNPMEHNVTDILFWEHVKKYVTSDTWQLILTLQPSFQNWPGQSTKHFIGCSNWENTWRDHDTASIPEDIDPDMLKRLFKQKSLSEFETILSCACIVPGHVGGKIRRCRKILLWHSQISTSFDFVLRLSPLCWWDIEQNGSAWVRSH